MKKRILSIITALALVIALLPTMGMPARAAAILTANNSDEFHRALTAAQDGDVIQVNGSFVVKNPVSNNDSLVIDKAVTIQGGGLTLWYAGILLGADVTFKDITLGLGSNVRPAIMANGHTLTLENVQRDPTCRYIHLFCGGQTGATQGDLSDAKQGGHGQIILRGNTNLGLANIYAGSISTDGTNNVFAKPATVTIDETVKGQPIEHIYACGALQTYTSEDDWFDYEHEINPPFASPGNFKVSGKVTLNLYGTTAKRVSGDTGVLGNLAQVNYKGTDFLNDSLVLSSIGGLIVESGNLAPAAGELVQNNADTADRTAEIVPVSGGSCFVFNNAPLGVAANATLGLKNLDNTVTIGDFTGGGILILGKDQTLSISGTVTETTKVAIGYTNFDNTQSTTQPTQGRCYIQAPRSQDGAFTLLPYATQPNMTLVRDDSGNWTVPAQTEETSKLRSLAPEDTRADSGETEILVPLKSTYSGDGLYIEDISLILRVNGTKASFHEDDTYPYFEVAGLHIYVGDSGNGEELQIYAASSFSDPVPDNVYRIEVVVPGTYTVSGADLTASFTLTVGDVAPEPVSIPVPRAIPGLVWTGAEQTGVNGGTGYTLTGHKATAAGSYTATATLASGYRWEDGTTAPRTIPWTIARAAAPAAPTGLSGVAPTSTGGTDGKITGTNTEMEYSAGSDFSNPQTCGAGETAGLAAGTYYVRVKGNNDRIPGEMAQVAVPAYEAPTPGHQHTWSGDWSASATHHWHNCTGENCPIQENGQKNGYAAHIPGEWVTDKAPTATEAGRRHRFCTICGYEMARETIPATGGSTGGGSSGGDSTGGGATGGGGSAGTGGGGISFPAKDKEPEEEKKPINTPVYHDVPANAWYKDAVSFVTEKGLMSGTRTNTFAPNDNLTRAMLAQILYNNEERPPASGSSFTDVKSGAWYADAVSWATQKGIVSGYGNGRFGPNNNITREQLAVMLWRYAGSPISTASLNSFTDQAKAGKYALAALRWAVEKGIISDKGNGTLDPKGNATRAEVAHMLMNYFAYK